MGLEGTEVAKGASDMILTDDNFCSIVKAIEKGRIIYAGIQKFVSFIMSVHFAEVLQILLFILVTDLPPSIALGFEPGEALTMKRAPRPKTQPVVMMWMWRGIVANGMILTVCIFCTYMLALHAYAGAFQSDDITGGRYGNQRQTCAIWKKNNWSPQPNFNCAIQLYDEDGKPKLCDAKMIACANAKFAEAGLKGAYTEGTYKDTTCTEDQAKKTKHYACSKVDDEIFLRVVMRAPVKGEKNYDADYAYDESLM